MDRRQIVDALFEAAIEEAKQHDCNEVVVRYGGNNFISWTFPLHVDIDTAEKNRDEYLQNVDMLNILFQKKDDSVHSVCIVLDAQKNRDEEYLRNNDITLSYIEHNDGEYDTSMNIIYSDAVRDGKGIKHTEDYQYATCHCSKGKGEELLKEVEDYIDYITKDGRDEAEFRKALANAATFEERKEVAKEFFGKLNAKMDEGKEPKTLWEESKEQEERNDLHDDFEDRDDI